MSEFLIFFLLQLTFHELDFVIIHFVNSNMRYIKKENPEFNILSKMVSPHSTSNQ